MSVADLAVVKAIECETFSPWSFQSLAQELEVSGGVQIVAETSEAQIVGWCACRVIWPEAELLKIAVKKENRRCGVGRFLFEYLFRELQKRKVACLFLEVRSGNHTALDFYTEHHFVQVGSRPNYYTDPSDSAVILKKNLS
jgi:[ribosomal protein S18]-alanine N-acetyltransferase